MENAVMQPEISEAHGNDLSGKYLTFVLAQEEYGLQILKVQEIIRLQEITKVPRTPSFVRGVINLRGRVIPIIELRTKFEMPPKEDDEKTCIVVVQVSAGEATVTMGIIIDDVREVRDITAAEIEETPSFGTKIETDFILGMGRLEKRVLILIDIDKILSAQQIEHLTSLNQKSEA